ncbi:MAG: PTS IIA-like nitrogen regulatory protein PtsN [Gammaproteobacteria bacterium]|nr:PTS IIA-like nitrogen regulatory protein PtsN [Gammaproteobacteria bacterium]
MFISEILTPERILCDVNTNSKKDALQKLSRLFSNNKPALTSAEIFDCLNERERLGSTGLGNGIAMPHGRFQHVDKPIAAFLKLKSGINFDALDQQPVDLLFALLVPEGSNDEHLQILARLAEMFCNDGLLTHLRLESSAHGIYILLTS